jgi:hypothetical protein
MSGSSDDTSTTYVVSVDSRNSSPSDIGGYKEETCDAAYFQKTIVENPKMKCCISKVAELCGLNLKIYFMKYQIGLAQHYRQGGEAACMIVLQRNPDFLHSNNGAVSWLTVDPINGLPEYTVNGKAYIVQDDGKAKLSKGQAWAMQEMVNCAMNIYDMDPANMADGKETLERWSKEYREKTWIPQSGCGDVDIYSKRR